MDFVKNCFIKYVLSSGWLRGLRGGSGLQTYQDALIEEIFQFQDKMKFVINEKEPTEVSTWDGKVNGYLSHYQLEKLARQTSILGPVAGIHGRDIEQDLMNLRGYLVSERKFE